MRALVVEDSGIPAAAAAPAAAGLQAVVFDMDGLMLDTERVALECWTATAAELGWEIARETFVKLVGLDQQESRKVLLECLGDSFPLAEVSARARISYLARLREGIPLKPGLLALLDWLALRRIRVAVATSTRSDLAREKLALAGIDRRFVTVACADEVGRGKPAPDVYLAAVGRLEVDPARCIALEDTDVGLRAAHGAGLRCILVPDLRPPLPEYEPLAHAIVPSLREAQPLIEAMLD